jgi:hypothetical protein
MSHLFPICPILTTEFPCPEISPKIEFHSQPRAEWFPIEESLQTAGSFEAVEFMLSPTGNPFESEDLPEEIPITPELQKLLNVLHLISLQHARNGIYRKEIAAQDISEDW